MSTSRTLALALALSASLAAAAAFAGGPGTLKFDQSSLAVGESAGTVTIWVERSQGEDGTVSVVVSSTGGSATPGADFAPVSQMLSWAPNDGTSKAVQVAIVDDAASESVETVQLTLAGATGGATIDPTRASFTLTLVDNDGGSPPPPRRRRAASRATTAATAAARRARSSSTSAPSSPTSRAASRW